MTLRRKAILIVSLIVGLQLVLLHVTFSHTVIEGFTRIERANVIRDVKRVHLAVQAVVESLQSKTSDWAFWDDTYRFLSEGDDEYVRSNLNPTSIADLNLDHVLFFDRAGELVVGRTLLPDRVSYSAVPDIIIKTIREHEVFLRGNSDNDTRSGLVTAGDQVLLFAAYPVLTSERKGPAVGTVVFAQSLNEWRVQAIAETAAVKLAGGVAARMVSDPGFLRFVQSGQDQLVEEVSQDENFGYGRIFDFDDNPAFVFRISEDREIFRQGLLTGTTISSLLILSGLIGLLMTLLALDRVLVRRLAKVNGFMQQLARDGDLSRRLEVSDGGQDEIRSVGVEINSMLDVLQKAHVELAVTSQQALCASQAKSEFLANMSHEIRTPMNGIVGLTELLLDSSLNTDQRHCLELVNTSSQRMLAIINDILDFSRIEAGKVELNPQHVVFKSFIQDFIAFMDAAASSKGVEIVPIISADIPEQLIVDSHRLGQILSNLIGNATKFTRRGGFVMVFAELKEHLGDGMTLQFSVSDTGIGISREKHQQIFEAFTQADGSITRDFGGTGLGLTISRQLVALLGGEIWMQSVPDVGSVFHFTIRCHSAPVLAPVAKTISAEESLAEGNLRSVAGLRILLVEDNSINQMVAQRMLSSAGYEVIIAEDGKQALNALDSQCENFALVLMDCQMPVMSGFEATRIIRQREREYGTHIPIVAMTANAMEGDRERCLAAGMDDYISKPVSRSALLALVRDHLRRPVSGNRDDI